MSKEERLKKRRNFLPGVLATLFLIVVWATFFFLIPPEYFLAPVAFLLITFFTVLFVVSLSLGNTRRGVIAGVGVLVFMGFGFYGLANFLNLILLISLLVSVEYYLSRRLN